MRSTLASTEVMAEDSGQSVLSLLESRILPLAPGLTDRLARRMCVLDAGCGRGRIMTRLVDGIHGPSQQARMPKPPCAGLPMWKRHVTHLL
jgi:hypothetical protein